MSNDFNKDNNSVAAWIVKFLIKRKVKVIYGLQGGHIQPIWDFCYKLGIKIVDVRDEKAAVHMAQAYSIITNNIGVAMVTAGPGVTNTVTGVANASLALSPVLIIGGCTPIKQSNMGPLQDIPHVDIMKPITRYARTARVSEQVIRELDLAISYALGTLGEPGPSYIEIPTDVLRKTVPEKLIFNDLIKEKKPYNIYPNPKDIKLLIDKIENSKKPLLISGRGANNCKESLINFLDKNSILYLDTQDSRGVIPYEHSSNVYAARSKVMSEADLIILLGRKLDYQLAYGSPAIFKNASFVRISDVAHELVDNRRGDPEIFANPKIVFEKLNSIDLKLKIDRKWVSDIKNFHSKKLFNNHQKSQNKLGKDLKIHPEFIFSSIRNIVNDNFFGIADGGDLLFL